ncbi:hypothetical protein D3870_08555 [Noviherbaspirillum cavernae]|uniref:Uncharacterized protein n=1 Tax=Noviherbaspirillum cavernae TaxID=2320862 RepID=A0A418X0N5_9BURK|nr:hypothetical protein [Noviherbaspirillum cavernae]RJG06054.1 hypothetical protein D3870_08555 [Noviherbaspirillum cavernae]
MIGVARHENALTGDSRADEPLIKKASFGSLSFCPSEASGKHWKPLWVLTHSRGSQPRYFSFHYSSHMLRSSVGVGIGPYFLIDKPRKPNGEEFSSVSAMVSVTAAYAISPTWNARLL